MSMNTDPELPIVVPDLSSIDTEDLKYDVVRRCARRVQLVSLRSLFGFRSYAFSF
jgi:hypothetical protein